VAWSLLQTWQLKPNEVRGYEMGSDTSIDRYLGIDVPLQEFSNPLPDDTAQAVIDALKQEADRHFGIDPHRSLEYAERIIKIGKARGDTRQSALGWMARGDALKFIGHTSEAWESLDKAGTMYRQAGDEVGWARTRIGRLYLSTMMNCVSEAMLETEEAREIFIRSGEREKLLRLEIQTGYVHSHLGNKLESLQRFQTALEIVEELGEPGQRFLGVLYTNLGSSFEGLGDLVQAQAFYEQAQIFFSAEGEILHLATVEANLGYLAQKQGKYRRALQLLTSSAEKAAGHSDLESTKIKWHLLECYKALNRRAEAHELAREIVADSRELKSALELALALMKLADIEAEKGNFTAAQTALDEAEVIFTSLNAATWTANTWLRRGSIALKQGDALTAGKKAEEAAAVFESAGQQVNDAMAALLKSRASLALGDLFDAEAEAKKALRTAQLDNVASLRFAAHLQLGQILEQQNANYRALRHYQAAAATTERVQRGLTITLSPGFLEDKMDAWIALIRLNLQKGEVDKAFEILERSKSQVLFGYLANRETLLWSKDDPKTRGLIEKLDRLRGEHQWYSKLTHETPISPDHPAPLEPEQALLEVNTRERKIRAITEQLYMESAEGRSYNPYQLPSLELIRESLDVNSMVVEYYNDGRNVWVFTLDRGSIEVHRLPVKLKDINRLLAQLQMNMASALQMNLLDPAARNLTRLTERILQRLYTGLLEPVERRLNRRQLLIVPYGALHYLPFHLLHDGTAYLIEKHEIVILPSAGLTVQPAPRRQPEALILANSYEGRLDHALEEGEIVLRLFGGRLYTEQAADRTALKGKPIQILHIAAHGQFRLDQPDLSYIQLADGQLYADDLLQEDLSYELVTLSACETGLANVTGGEELIGLGRGILYAGAGALVLSLWPVPDKIAVVLMENMYSSLREGASKAAALREAQLSILGKHPNLHPAYWGAFQLTGNPGPLSQQEE
jgi:CHAT domain-containing protein